MNPVPFVSWVLLFFWSVWLFALSGWAATGSLGSFAPDLGLVLLVTLESRQPGNRAFVAALIVSAARLSLGTDPALAVIAGYVGAVGAAGLLRRAVELDRSFSRAVYAGLAALALSMWWMSSRWVVLAGQDIVLPPPHPAWRGALATGVVTLVFSGLFLRLPGLTPFAAKRRRRP